MCSTWPWAAGALLHVKYAASETGNTSTLQILPSYCPFLPSILSLTLNSPCASDTGPSRATGEEAREETPGLTDNSAALTKCQQQPGQHCTSIPVKGMGLAAKHSSHTGIQPCSCTLSWNTLRNTSCFSGSWSKYTFSTSCLYFFRE